jgi:uncharacterized membrane protein YccC
VIVKQFRFVYEAIEAAFIGVICFWIGGYISQVFHDGKGYIDGLWCMISALVVLQSLAFDVLKAAKSRVIGTLVASVISGFLCWLLSYNYFVIILAIGLSAYIMNLLDMSDGVRIATATAAVITGYGFLNPDYSPVINALMRSVDTIIGVLFSVLIVFVSYQLHIRQFKTIDEKSKVETSK